jgi:iron complex transport system substrate-binding protein
MDYYPQRIVCLTEETTELLYLIGEQDRIVGISGFTVRPKQARKEKPKVSAFIDANIDEILNLKPDLVIGFSDIQADIAQELIKKGVTVWVNNHRSVEEILKMIVQLGALVGRTQTCLDLVNHYQKRITEIQSITAKWSAKPKVYLKSGMIL